MKTLVSAIGAVVFTVALSAGNPADMPQSKPTQTAPKSTGGHPAGSDRGSSDRASRMWWKVPEVIKEIGLTPEQAKAIDNLFQKRLPEAMARETEYKKQQAILDKLMLERTVGADVVGVQVDRVEALRTTQVKTRTIMFYEMHKVLSAEQYKKLVAYWDRTRGRGDSRNK